MKTELKFRIAARALIVQDNRLLFVSDDGDHWYLPGGRLEGKESLTECVEREVYEETGLVVKTGNLLHVLECFDLEDHLHKIHFYFQAVLLTGDLLDTWQDEGGSVQFRQYFSLAEIKKNPKILPRFLINGDWCQPSFEFMKVYQGLVFMKGFEMLNALDHPLPEINY
jgi:8-oxo-dGTP pyrophosphatase MutT (NUDIX family)